MDDVQAEDQRLRLAHRTFWLPGPDEDTNYSQRMIWSVDGIAGAVSLSVDIGGFKSGEDEEMARELRAYELRGEDRFAFVQAGLAARGIWAHAARPWLNIEEGGYEEHSCPLLDDRPCWSRLLVGEHQPELHNVMLRLVQPGGPTYVWEYLEDWYRGAFHAKPSPYAEGRKRAEEAFALAAARAEGAERAVNAAASTVDAVAMSPDADARPQHTSSLSPHEHRIDPDDPGHGMHRDVPGR